MKKTFLITVLALITLGSPFFLAARDFKGVITYKITFTGMEIDDQMKSVLPQTLITKYKGKMSISELIMGMGKTAKIKNGEDESLITLMDMMGQKFAVESTPEEIKAGLEGQPEFTVEITGATKEILGYECRQAIITSMKGDGSTLKTSVYFSEELGTNTNHFDTKQFLDIKGIMLEFEVRSANLIMVFTATSIEKQNVPDSEFEIPDDYEIKSPDEIKQMFGGGGGGF